MSFRNFKVLTFDVVGTLIDFERGILQSVRRIAGHAAAELTEEDIFEPYKRGRDAHHGRSSEVMGLVYIHLAKELGLPADDRAAEAFQMDVLRWPPFPDSADALKRLRRRFRLVAMTNADQAAFSFYSHVLGDPFHDSVTSDDTGCSKPDPRFFAFNRGRRSAFGYMQDEMLHVAQSQHHDISIAKAQGYKTCWIERRQGQKGFGGTPAVAQLAKPDFHFATLKALADAVEAEL
ncbi:MAG TPA: HAD-IA family hydrolase [Stellaceae bacterium]|nr:HAD-IA family hydrolase [Stellaceae bacterium]